MPLVLFALLSACGTPVVGALPEGVYGSPDIGLRVDATGRAVFERSCYQGDLGIVDVVDGSFVAEFRGVRTGGDPPLDTGADAGTPATVDATASTTLIEGTITSEGDEQDLHLVFGREPTYFECP